MKEDLLWWEKGIIYQIYPRSFMDSNDDGIGDIEGIIGKLGYLKWLGVDIIWLSPLYPSPMKDLGYDVSDYCNIHPIFGTLNDFDRLLAKVHEMGMKLIMDFVPNHTSDEHPWFKESRSSRDNSKRDWYIWKDPSPDGGPPNNWLSNFGGPAWHLDEKTGQYYYHAFLPEQPDLNWRNPEVVNAMLDNMRFWLDRGVDGFRVDVIWHIIKDDEFRDNPLNPEYEPHYAPHRQLLETYTSDRPEVHEIIEKMRHVLDSYEERMMVGEIYLPIERLVAYYGSEGKGAHLPFNFHLVHVPWTPRDIASVVENYEASLPEFGWPNWVLGNHDNHRVASRFGDRQIRIAGMLLLTLRGTPTMYYGDEVGMHDVHIPKNLIQDPFEKNVPGMGHGRDPERTPMQWDQSENAGFTKGTPWLPVACDYQKINVEIQKDDSGSTLTFYRRLITLRRENPELCAGIYKKIFVDDEIFVYLRESQKEKFLIALNLCNGEKEYKSAYEGRIMISTYLDRKGEESGEFLRLRPSEGVLIKIN